MIKPDVMDGVPEEEGYYFCKYKDSEVWELVEVIKVDILGNEEAEAYFPGVEHTWIDEKDFDNYTWSERVEEPTPDVDNLSDG